MLSAVKCQSLTAYNASIVTYNFGNYRTKKQNTKYKQNHFTVADALAVKSPKWTRDFSDPNLSQNSNLPYLNPNQD